MKLITRLLCLSTVAFLFICAAAPAGALYTDDQTGYTYDSQAKRVPAPASYLETLQITGESSDAGNLSGVADLAVWEDRLYALDKTGGRILVYDRNGSLVSQLGVDWGMNAPEGLTVSGGFIYVADTKNARIMKADLSGAVQSKLGGPDSAKMMSGVDYEPIRIAVNSTESDDSDSGQIFVIARNNTNGILQLDHDGAFIGYYGSVPVVPSGWELFWRRFSSPAQLARMLLFIPTEYNSLEMDERGYVYVTVSSIGEKDLQTYLQGGGSDAQLAPVRRLNAKGTDILKRQGFVKPGGDVPQNGETPSKLIDVSARGDGLYAVLDSTGNRVFTYDGDGNLLGIFGGTTASLSSATSICWWGDRIAVADAGGNGSIKVFSPTNYATLMIEGVLDYKEGRYDQASEKWNRVETMHSGSDLAKLFIGREYLRQGDYARAKAYFRAADRASYYSYAFEQQRRQQGTMAVISVVAAILALGAAAVIIKQVSKRRQRAAAPSSPAGVFRQDIRFAFHLMRHPFSGFWDLKFERRGKPLIALLITAAVVILNLVSYRATGYIVAGNNQSNINLLSTGILGILLPAGLWCLANWSVTALMNGAGRMRDILIYTGYSLLPLCLGLPVLILMSHAITLNELNLYGLVQLVTYGYMFSLLFIGTLVTHQYMALRTVVTILVIILAMAIIVFLCLLSVTLVQQIVEFIVRLAEEIAMRA